MYSVTLFTSLDGCRMHRVLDYEAALKWIYETRAAYTTVYANNDLICKNEPCRRALLLIVRHNHAKA